MKKIITQLSKTEKSNSQADNNVCRKVCGILLKHKKNRFLTILVLALFMTVIFCSCTPKTTETPETTVAITSEAPGTTTKSEATTKPETTTEPEDITDYDWTKEY